MSIFIEGKPPRSLEGESRLTKPSGPPWLTVQWQGTEVCGDFRCPCGFDTHLDDVRFLFFIRCPDCRSVYRVNPHIELVPLTAEETAGMSPLASIYDPPETWEDE